VCVFAIRNRIVHMRIAWLLIVVALCASAQDDKKEVVSVVNKLFEGMAARDSGVISSTMTPDAKLVAAQDSQTFSTTTGEQFAQRIGANQSRVVERMWNPTVLVRGRIAMVWADYDVYVAGKFGHCGIDAFTLLKTDAGWKISGVQYTSETQGCTPNPLGPPPQ
jgi:Putative lumazine-binding